MKVDDKYIRGERRKRRRRRRAIYKQPSC